MGKVAVLFHNYYGHDQDWFSFFSNNAVEPTYLFYNGVGNSYHRNKDSLTDNFFSTLPATPSNIKQVVYRSSPNNGKDIGGKMILLDAYLKLGLECDALFLCHDKRSPHLSNGLAWRDGLLSVFHLNKQKEALRLLRQDNKVGIVAAAGCVRDERKNIEQRNAYVDTPIINQLREKFSINPPNLDYVAGTMFWVRASIFEQFFSKHAPLEIRSMLEGGETHDDMPTATHAWERLLCWLVTANGFTIKAI